MNLNLHWTPGENPVIPLWAFAVFLSALFAEILAAQTLTPKVNRNRLIRIWVYVTIGAYLINLFSYWINLYNDFVPTVGQCVYLCLVLIPLYEGTVPEKLFVGMTASLMSNVATFMFCGTSDTFIGAELHLFDDGNPYNIRNIALFICIKLVVFTVLYILFIRFFRHRFVEILRMSEGQMRSYLYAPIASVLGFYIVNLVTNNVGILPANPWFLPLYGTICVIFVMEYIQTFNSIIWTAQAKKIEAEKERIGADLKVATQIQADML
ncbi:MAG: hypothetical protein IJT34_00950, partial [Butyrivibrio sp.]|nr:hypothetical protein [Butyrivibrio sp.]